MDLKVLRLTLCILILLMVTNITSAIAQSTGNDSPTPVEDMLKDVFSNPKTAIIVAIQFALGLALGYVSIKMIRYVLAFIGILVLGAVLQVWGFGGSIEGAFSELFKKLQSVIPEVKSYLVTLGLLTVGPTAIGFIIGIVIGVIRK